MAHKFKQTSGTAQAVSGALLRTAKACALLGISKTTLYTWSKIDHVSAAYPNRSALHGMEG